MIRLGRQSERTKTLISSVLLSRKTEERHEKSAPARRGEARRAREMAANECGSHWKRLRAMHN